MSIVFFYFSHKLCLHIYSLFDKIKIAFQTNTHYLSFILFWIRTNIKVKDIKNSTTALYLSGQDMWAGWLFTTLPPGCTEWAGIEPVMAGFIALKRQCQFHPQPTVKIYCLKQKDTWFNNSMKVYTAGL